MDFIIKKFNEIIYNACERYSKDDAVTIQQMQVVFFEKGEEEEELGYQIWRDYKPTRDVTFNNILDVRIDFKGYSILVPKFILDTLEGFSEKYNQPKSFFRVICVVNEEHEVRILLYSNRGEFLELIELEQLI